VALVLHIGAAFHYYHQWSHAAAVADTARQTGEIIGWKFGEGIYFNYLFAAVWLGDCFWWWRSPQSYWLRARWMTAAIHAYLAFIAFQAVVVFEEGMVRVVGIAATAALVILAGRFWFAGRRKSA
jgi:hypothetical protein